ncbi:AMP-binding protein [Tritonibacter horizontis]|uniref:Putative acyl--CoA ligase YhfT n=1 Tax=Tritonibacter horizontis TaxID=1768241 RepID=A0A132C2U7_9RHOB|nr:AMP-binding protein [Tritonibacter horizontis]KUP94985.1 putative acyl--CoA ligase YhfT [Tritonibacter horizontis]
MSLTTFRMSAQTCIRTPDVAGLAELTEALRTGKSILARPGENPISAKAEPQQKLYCQSSGSTGFAKTIRRAPESWTKSFEIDQQLFGLSGADTFASLGTLSHSLTLFAAVAACHFGADLAMLGGAGPRAQQQGLAEFAASVLYATPAQLRLLVRAAGATRLPSLRLIFSSGGKLNEDLRSALGSLCPNAQLYEIFGASETSYITLAGHDVAAHSVGQSYPGVEIRIADPDAQGVGEIWVQSPYLFEGYAQGSSAETRWDRGWLSIGEMGRLDAKGNLFSRGRRNRMVTVADKNVFPEEIEAVLLATPGVVGAVALGLPDPMRGHRVVAVIEGTADAATLRQRCRDQIGGHAVPKHIHRIDKIPMLPAGKPDLQALRQFWEEG